MGKYTERIERGAALLDEERPGWRDLVDLDRLDLGSCSSCVLGQLLGGYSRMADVGLRYEADAAEHGFQLDDDEEGIYSVLTREWREYIRETRSAVSA